MNNKNILLLHGWGASAHKLSSLESELKKLGWQVMNLDLPGFGGPPLKKIWSLDDYLDFVEKKANTIFTGGYIAFGHSFGARIAIKLAYKKPANLCGVVLCSAGGISRPHILKRTLFITLAKVGKPLVHFGRAGGVWRKMLYKFAREHDYEKTDGVLRETFKGIIREDVKKYLKGISVPTLILWGDKDKVTPISDARYLNKHIAMSKYQIFANARHSLPYDYHDDVATAINIWKF